MALPLECGLLAASIHPAIDRAFSVFDAPRARAAANACTTALAERLASGGSPWEGSRLTGDGFPFELAFTTADPRVRFTVEPGARALPSHARLDAAARAVRWLGSPAVPAGVLQGLRQMQAGHALGFGAWVSCRADARGVAAKIYAEVPQSTCLRSASVAPGTPEAVPRIVAYTPATGAFEVYLRARGAAPGELAALLAAGGVERHAAAALAYVEEIHGHRLRDRLPGPVGVSYAWPAAPGATLHFYARALWGPDAAIRRGFSRAARALGWDEGAYLCATQPIAERNDWRTYHGLVGVTLGAAGAISLTIGLRPIAP